MSEETAVCGHSYSGSEGRCERSVWGDHDHCIWHTDKSKKPADALRDAREDGPECLDDCVLTDVTFDDPITFEDCSMQNADLVRADLSGADLSGADLSNAALFNADLTKARLIRADLSNAILNSATLRNVSGIYADLEECKGWEADFSGADLRNANISNAVLPKSTCRGGSLHQCNLERTDLREANLRETEFNWANMRNADLREANLENADLYGADLNWSNLERTVLTNSHLLETSLVGARLFSGVFDGVQINNGTEFGQRCIYDPAFSSADYSDIGEVEPTTATETITDPTRASETYGSIKQMADESALPEVASHFFILRKDLLRIGHRQQSRYGLWARAWMSKIVVQYGESPWRVLGVGGIVTILCGLLYPLGLLRRFDTGNPVTYPDQMLSVDTLSIILDGLYFSTLTFTTLGGYEEFQPRGLGRLLVLAQTSIGIVLLALLVFVFGRRATR